MLTAEIGPATCGYQIWQGDLAVVKGRGRIVCVGAVSPVTSGLPTFITWLLLVLLAEVEVGDWWGLVSPDLPSLKNSPWTT